MPAPFSHAGIAAKLLRNAAAFYHQVAKQDPALANRLLVNADIAEQVAAMIETDPTGAANRWPEPSFKDEFYTPTDQVKNGYGGAIRRKPPTPRPEVDKSSDLPRRGSRWPRSWE